MDDRIATACHAVLGDDPIRAIVRDFALGIQVLRLYECGFEAHINTMEPAEIILMGTMALPHQREVLMQEGLRRADERLLAALSEAGVIEPDEEPV